MKGYEMVKDTNEEYIECVAKGDSMYPVIADGNKLIVKRGIESLDINQIILYKDCNKIYFVHRIVDFFYCGGVPMVITKGDSCVYEDKPIQLHNIIGVVVKIIKN